MTMKGLVSATAASALLTLAATGLLAQPAGGPPGEHHDHKAARVQVTKAVAVLHPTQGSQVHGVIHFTKVEDGIRVHGTVHGLTPGKHGFHVHEFGDCSAPDAKSAGGHFNPTGDPHSEPGAEHRHVGDFGNLEADEKGDAHYDRVDTQIRLRGNRSILGRAVIVHEKADDLKTQPTGDAGGRVACGVIGVAQGGVAPAPPRDDARKKGDARKGHDHKKKGDASKKKGGGDQGKADAESGGPEKTEENIPQKTGGVPNTDTEGGETIERKTTSEKTTNPR